MPTIAGELSTSTEDATECADLAEFSCGDGHLAAEGVVERIISACRTGEKEVVTFRVTREMPPGHLVGLAAIDWPGLVYRSPAFPRDAFEDAAYIAVISLAARYRGGYTTADGKPLSHVLLADALEHISADSESEEMPPVQAIIEPANVRSRALFEHFGFIQPVVTSPDLWYLRPRGLPLGEPEGNQE
jgi:hypothetical protein